MLLRVAIWAAAQQLRGEEAEEFWTLIHEVSKSEEAMRALDKMKVNLQGDKL